MFDSALFTAAGNRMAAAVAQCGVCSAMPEAPVPNYPWLEGHS